MQYSHMEQNRNLTLKFAYSSLVWRLVELFMLQDVALMPESMLIYFTLNQVPKVLSS